MVALETPMQAAPRREPLSPPAAAFLAAYVRCRADIVAAAQQLSITLEAALDLLTDPAVASRMEVIDESQKRAARYAAIDNISHAATVLSDLAKNAPDAPTRQKAASNLYRASIWLVRIAENKVPPDRLPARYLTGGSSPGVDTSDRVQPNHSPEGESAMRFASPVGVTAASPTTHSHPSPVLDSQTPPQEAREPVAPTPTPTSRPGTGHVSVRSDRGTTGPTAHPEGPHSPSSASNTS